MNEWGKKKFEFFIRIYLTCVFELLSKLTHWLFEIKLINFWDKLFDAYFKNKSYQA